MKPTPSEEILIVRILDSISDSGKTELGIANYIKAKFYRIETTYEIKRVIKKYLLGVKIFYEPNFEVFKLLIGNVPIKENYSNQKLVVSDFFQIPEKVSFLNELYKRRQDLLRLPIEDRLKYKRLEIIETNTEIEYIKPLAVQELSQLQEIERLEIIKYLFPLLRAELEKIQFTKDELIVDEDEINKDSQVNLENNIDKDLDLETKQTFDENKPLSYNFNSDDIIFDYDIDYDESQIQFKQDIITDNVALEKDADESYTESEINKKREVQSRAVLPDTKLTIEQAINLIIEEKIRLGTLEGNLLAENIIFRLKKGKWG
jgi:hypothetical protein